MSAGRRNYRIAIIRQPQAESAFGEPVASGEPQILCRPYAEISHGTGQERREAAMEGAKISATFRVLATLKTRSVQLSDIIAFDGFDWDIESNVPFGRSRRDITAVRRA